MNQFSIALQAGDKFVVTGRLYNSKRHFPAKTFDNIHQARSINLWNGNIWLLRNNKRTLIESVRN
jgi:hypothetical protein